MILRGALSVVAVLAISASSSIADLYWLTIPLGILGGSIVGWLAASPGEV